MSDKVNVYRRPNSSNKSDDWILVGPATLVWLEDQQTLVIRFSTIHAGGASEWSVDVPASRLPMSLFGAVRKGEREQAEAERERIEAEHNKTLDALIDLIKGLKR